MDRRSHRWNHLGIGVAYLVAVTMALLGLRLWSGAGLPLLPPMVVAVALAFGLAGVVAPDGDRPTNRSAGRGDRQRPDGSPALVARVTEIVNGLDGVEHRHLELGGPLPYLLVGPSGLRVVDVHLGAVVAIDDHGVSSSSRDLPTMSVDLVHRLRRLFADERLDPAIDVRAVAVVSDGADIIDRTTIDLSDGAAWPLVTVVEIADLARALTEGPMVSMETVDRAFAVATAEALRDDAIR